AGLLAPEAAVEGLACAIGALAHLGGAHRVAALGEPALHQAQRVVPEGVDLDRLAAPGCHPPVARLGVHPGELIARRALTEKAVGAVHPDSERRAADVVID